MTVARSLIAIKNVHAGYGSVRVLHGVDVEVREGETVALLGTNGNGKSTLIRCIMGMVRPEAGEITLELDGQRIDLTRRSTEEIVDLGIALVPEGRRLFTGMSVRENLELGSYLPAARRQRQASLDTVLDLFPVLREKLASPAGELSGGQQQMVAIGRALMARPRLLLLDEPSLGLSPLITHEVFAAIRRINAEGTAVLLVEQNVALAMRMASRAYVLEEGRIAAEGAPEELLARPEIQRAYLGV